MILQADNAQLNDVLLLLQTSFLNLSKLCKTLRVHIFNVHIVESIVHAGLLIFMAHKAISVFMLLWCGWCIGICM